MPKGKGFIDALKGTVSSLFPRRGVSKDSIDAVVSRNVDKLLNKIDQKFGDDGHEVKSLILSKLNECKSHGVKLVLVEKYNDILDETDDIFIVKAFVEFLNKFVDLNNINNDKVKKVAYIINDLIHSLDDAGISDDESKMIFTNAFLNLGLSSIDYMEWMNTLPFFVGVYKIFGEDKKSCMYALSILSHFLSFKNDGKHIKAFLNFMFRLKSSYGESKVLPFLLFSMDKAIRLSKDTEALNSTIHWFKSYVLDYLSFYPYKPNAVNLLATVFKKADSFFKAARIVEATFSFVDSFDSPSTTPRVFNIVSDYIEWDGFSFSVGINPLVELISTFKDITDDKIFIYIEIIFMDLKANKISFDDVSSIITLIDKVRHELSSKDLYDFLSLVKSNVLSLGSGNVKFVSTVFDRMFSREKKRFVNLCRSFLSIVNKLEFDDKSLEICLGLVNRRILPTPALVNYVKEKGQLPKKREKIGGEAERDLAFWDYAMENGLSYDSFLKANGA